MHDLIGDLIGFVRTAFALAGTSPRKTFCSQNRLQQIKMMKKSAHFHNLYIFISLFRLAFASRTRLRARGMIAEKMQLAANQQSANKHGEVMIED